MMREITGMLVTAIASAKTSTNAVRSPAAPMWAPSGSSATKPEPDEERHHHAGDRHRDHGASFVGLERRPDLRSRAEHQQQQTELVHRVEHESAPGRWPGTPDRAARVRSRRAPSARAAARRRSRRSREAARCGRPGTRRCAPRRAAAAIASRSLASSRLPSVCIVETFLVPSRAWTTPETRRRPGRHRAADDDAGGSGSRHTSVKRAIMYCADPDTSVNCPPTHTWSPVEKMSHGP